MRLVRNLLLVMLSGAMLFIGYMVYWFIGEAWRTGHDPDALTRSLWPTALGYAFVCTMLFSVDALAFWFWWTHPEGFNDEP